MITIRKATMNDLETIEKLYHLSRIFMASHGNDSQWGTNYPYIDIVLNDIKNRNRNI